MQTLTPQNHSSPLCLMSGAGLPRLMEQEETRHICKGYCRQAYYAVRYSINPSITCIKRAVTGFLQWQMDETLYSSFVLECNEWRPEATKKKLKCDRRIVKRPGLSWSQCELDTNYSSPDV